MNISLLSWYCGKNWKNTIKKLQKSGMSGIRTRDRQLKCRARSPLNHGTPGHLLNHNRCAYCIVAVTMSRDVDGK